MRRNTACFYWAAYERRCRRGRKVPKAGACMDAQRGRSEGDTLLRRFHFFQTLSLRRVLVSLCTLVLAPIVPAKLLFYSASRNFHILHYAVSLALQVRCRQDSRV